MPPGGAVALPWGTRRWQGGWGGQQWWDITVQEGCIAVGQGVGQAMGWDGAGRQWVLHTHPTESFCSPQPPLHLGSPVPAGVQGGSRVASHASWVVPPLGGLAERDKGQRIPAAFPACIHLLWLHPHPCGSGGSASLGRDFLVPPAAFGQPGSGVPRAKGETLPPWNSLPSPAP